MSTQMLGVQRSTTRMRAQRPKPPRRPPEEELELLAREITLEFRGKRVLRARTLTELVEECAAIPGLGEASARLLDFFEDTENGNWVDGSGLFRLGRVDHLNRLKRNWREFETRRSTLRQYLEKSSDCGLPALGIEFKLPPDQLESSKTFMLAFRNLIARLDRICHLVLQSGFRVSGFAERSTRIILEAESQGVFDFTVALLAHHRWHKEQRVQVRLLEEQADISPAYAEAAKSLASAQLRHLSVLVETSVRLANVKPDPGVVEKASELAIEYIGRLDVFDQEGAAISVCRPAPEEERAAS